MLYISRVLAAVVGVGIGATTENWWRHAGGTLRFKIRMPELAHVVPDIHRMRIFRARLTSLVFRVLKTVAAWAVVPLHHVRMINLKDTEHMKRIAPENRKSTR